MKDSVLDFVTSASNYSCSIFYHDTNDSGLFRGAALNFLCGLFFFQDEAEKAGEATLPTGENGNDSGISDAGETAEPAKDVFDLTLDKMDGL